ncbi:nucleotide disphospho-sugar-binding domain-containing protein [Streptomyces stackebrandtii]|uniref:nucleotide disphospho-sugar-binding domain-containing protein n=1 Tax=Streptomyces stackebrandtii TaxID=3051177 RepID=UPI0028DBB9B6|nr:nucleotide disphospho-sugar-binding domain-containing protein [Streptomyces sp. DSM 40976]
MRFLFTTFAWSSHYYPMVPLGWALQAAGHEVRVATTPSLVDAVVTTGLPAVAVGQDIDIVSRAGSGKLHDHERWPTDRDKLSGVQQQLVQRMAHTMIEVADAMADDLVTFARSWQPDLIVHESITFAAPVAAEVLGIPTVAHAVGMPLTPGMLVRKDGSPLSPAYVRLYEKFGATPRTAPSAWIDPCPPSMRVPGETTAPRLPVRYVPYNAPGAVPTWLIEPPTRPRVCITWGTSTVRMIGDAVTGLLSQVIEAVSGLGVDVVLTVSAATRAALGTVPDGVRVAESLPLHLLLPSCRAIVHQGGVGTALTAGVYGVPQLTVTQFSDQIAVGDMIAAGGAGRHLLHDDATVERITSHVIGLLDDQECRKAATLLQREIVSQPTPAAWVPKLVELAGRRAPAQA